jgi:hypothetical protein
MQLAIAIGFATLGLLALAAGAPRADGTLRTLLWVFAAALFLISACLLGLDALGGDLR